MRKLILALTFAALLTLTTALPAFASGTPCVNPGNGSPGAAGALDPGKAESKWFGNASGRCGS